jgi:hypothetical protein
MYSNERSFAILALDLWLYGGVADEPRPLFGREDHGDVEESSSKDFVRRNLIEDQESEEEFVMIYPDTRA